MKTIFKNSFLILSLFLISASSAFAEKDTYPIPEEKMIFDGTGVRGGRLVLPLEGNLDTFNPHLSSSVAGSKTLKSIVYEGIMSLNLETMKSDPGLAKSVDISEDGLTYTFHIRKGVRWSDGKPFTADDVIFNYQVVTDPNILASIKSLLEQKDGSFPEVKKIDDYTVQYKLKEVNVLFSNALSAIYLVPKHVWEDEYKAGKFSETMLISADPKTFVSTGPYMIEKFVPDQRIVLKRNPYYWKFDKNGVRLPYYDRIVRVIVPDFEATFVKFRNGETDMHELRADQVDTLLAEQEKINAKVYDLGPSYNTNYINFNMNTRKNKNGEPFVEAKKLKLFSDKRFRQAISYAIDRNSIVKTVFHGRATPIYGFVSPANKTWYNPDAKKYPYDLDKAKELINQMGYKDSNGDGILEYQDGTPIQFSIKTNSENAVRVQVANLMKKDFEKLGFDVVLKPAPFNSVIDNLNVNYDYDAIILGWGSAVPPDPVMSKSVLLSSGKSHAWNPLQEKPATEWEKKIDEALYANQALIDLDARKKEYNKITAIWHEELPQIMFAASNVYVAIRNHVGNAKPVSIRPYFDWNMEELYDKRLEK